MSIIRKLVTQPDTTLEVSVGFYHINHGERDCYDGCAIAIALQAATKKKWEVGGFYKNFPNMAVCKERTEFIQVGPLPEAAIDFMIDFDFERKVKPFKFELPLYTVRRLGTIDDDIDVSEALQEHLKTTKT